MIYNVKSGSEINKKDYKFESLMKLWVESNFEVQIFDISAYDSINSLMKIISERHQLYQSIGVIVVAGGDGTLNAVASQMLHREIPLGILPLGTFNYVARVLNIPLTLEEAAKTIINGVPQSVHVAKINEYIYLNNASLGLYPLFIKKREDYNHKWGRLPLHAYTSGLDVLIRDRKELKLTLKIDEKELTLKTPLLFFGNNQLQLSEMNLRIAENVAQGKVAGVVLSKSDKFTIFKTLLKLIQGKIEQANDVYSFYADNVTVSSTKEKLTVAVDGEIKYIDTPLKCYVEKNALKIMVPHAITSL